MTDAQMGVHLWPNRMMRPQDAVPFAQMLEASGVIDWFQTWDQLVSFYPQGLWRPDVTPKALAVDKAKSRARSNIAAGA